MKKWIIASCMTLFALCANAQTGWETVQKEKKANDGKDKTTIFAKSAKTIDPKYGVGAVPVVDGRVEWRKTIVIPNSTISANFEKAKAVLQALTEEKCQTEESRIVAINRDEHIIACRMVENLVFKSTAISLDQTAFRYSLFAEATNEGVTFRLCRITYSYEPQRPTAAIYTAEEWITDEMSINKKGTKLYPGNAKFRIKTIDRVETIFNTFGDALL